MHSAVKVKSFKELLVFRVLKRGIRSKEQKKACFTDKTTRQNNVKPLPRFWFNIHVTLSNSSEYKAHTLTANPPKFPKEVQRR